MSDFQPYKLADVLLSIETLEDTLRSLSYKQVTARNVMMDVANKLQDLVSIETIHIWRRNAISPKLLKSF